MRRKLTVRPMAQMDIVKHGVYLIEQQSASALQFRPSIRSAVSAIKANPRSYAVLDRQVLPDLELRFCKPAGFKSYLIIFQVTDDSVVILRVLHASQDIDAALRPS